MKATRSRSGRRIQAHLFASSFGFGHAHVGMRRCIAKMTTVGRRRHGAAAHTRPTSGCVFDLADGLRCPQAAARYIRSRVSNRLLMLPADTLVLPSHGKPFTRIAPANRPNSIGHQANGSQKCLPHALARAAAPTSIVPVLFKRQLDLLQMTFALASRWPHLHAPLVLGESLIAGLDGGVYRFAAT